MERLRESVMGIARIVDVAGDGTTGWNLEASKYNYFC